MASSTLNKNEIVFEGWFFKRGTRYKSWKKRNFVLFSDRSFKYYEDSKCTALKGTGSLDKVSHVTHEDGEEGSEICVFNGYDQKQDRTWHFRFASPAQQRFWTDGVTVEKIQKKFMNPSSKTNFNITVLGPGGVGKSSMVLRFIVDEFPEKYDPTIEDEYRIQTLVDGEMVLLSITDTAGQEEFSVLADDWIRTCDGVVLVYSVINRLTFEEIDNFAERVAAIRGVNLSSIPCCLAGNKIDLTDSIEVSEEEGKAKAEKFGCPFLSTSAKTNINVQEAFLETVRQIKNQVSDETPSEDAFCEIL